MPRHPPCALSSLSFQNHKIATKMLASTMQFSRYGRCLSPGATACLAPRCARQRGRSVRGKPMRVRKKRSSPQDPTACLTTTVVGTRVSTPAELDVLMRTSDCDGQIIDVPLNEQRHLETNAREMTHGQTSNMSANCSLERR